jgi:ankyrin repeat protein
MLLDAGADVNVRDRHGESPLQWAVVAGHVDIVHVLVDAGADINAGNVALYTPLHWAVKRDNLKMVLTLLGQKADVHARNKYGESPLDRMGSDVAQRLKTTYPEVFLEWWLINAS